MPNARPRKQLQSVLEAGLTAANVNVGVAALTITAGTAKLTKAAAATNSVVNIPVPKFNFEPGSENGRLASAAIAYSVGAAAFTGAPTAVLNKQTVNATTGAVTTSTTAATVAFVGTNTVGTAIGDYLVTITVTTPVSLQDNESSYIALTMNEAATSTWSINAVSYDFSG